MKTGDYWNIEDPKKPWGEFDPNAKLVFPIFVNEWLREMGTTYSSHEVLAASPLQCSDGVHAVSEGLDVIHIRVQIAVGADFKIGLKYPFTLRLVGANGSDGAGPLTDDRTLWLKLVQR